MGLRGGHLERRLVKDIRRLENRPNVGYLSATRHPWPCLFFVIPLLAAYEIGVNALASNGGVRAGVEVWIRQWVAQAGPVPLIVVPLSVVALLILWTLWRSADRPNRVVIPVCGMVVEGIGFGIGLWFLCLNAPALLEQAGLPQAAAGPPITEIITYLGVGVYEEVLFRLIGFALLARLLRILFVPALGAIPIAVVISAVAFALTHLLAQSDPFVPTVFAIRIGIGVYCALLFWLRGLGVAVGAHIVYDLILAGQSH